MGIAQTIRNAMRTRSQHEIERRYLDDATSLTDLERRQREIDRGLLRGRGF